MVQFAAIDRLPEASMSGNLKASDAKVISTEPLVSSFIVVQAPANGNR